MMMMMMMMTMMIYDLEKVENFSSCDYIEKVEKSDGLMRDVKNEL